MPTPDRTGYVVEPVDALSPYFIVSREDGTGIGAYPSEDSVDTAISADRSYLTTIQSVEPVVEEPVNQPANKSAAVKPDMEIQV